MTTTPDPDPVASLQAARNELRRARLRASESLHETRRTWQEQHDTLERLRNAAEREWWLRGKRYLMAPLRVLRHPVRTVRDGAHALFLVTRLHRLGPIAEHAFWTTVPLRAHPLAHQETNQASAAEAVRWLGAVSVRGVQRHALFAHPTSTVTWRLPIARPARVVISCALVPEAAVKNLDGVLFKLSVLSPGARLPLTTQLLVRPGTYWADQSWRTLTLDVPGNPDGDTEISVTTDLPDRGSANFAWALIGEPRLLWPRGTRDIVRRVGTLLRRDGLRVMINRARRVGTSDALVDYRRWVAAHALTRDDLARLRHEGDTFALTPTFTIICPVFNTEPRFLRDCIESVLAQAYQHWQLCLVDDASTTPETVAVLNEYASRDPRISVVRMPANGHISRASNAGLAAATGEFIALLDHDDTLSPDALIEMARFINTSPDVDFIYSDEDKLDGAGGRCEAYFKPDWSPEHFLNFMYTNHLMVVRRSVIDGVGEFRVGYEGSQDFDLALRVVTKTQRVGHVPKVLYHWRKIAESTAADAAAKPWALDAARRALKDHIARTEPDSQVLDAHAAGLFRVKRPVRGNPLVTLVITTDDRSRQIDGRVIPLLPHLLNSIVQKTAYANYEILVIDNGRLSDSTRDVLSGIRHRRVSYTIEGAFNFAHKLNFSMRHAHGEHAVILNDDIEVISSEWLSAMLEYSQDPAIGAVGARLLYPDGRLQHIGMVMGVCGVAAHAFHQAPPHSTGYAGSALGPRNYSAVTGACLMTRKAVFDEVGGFNERLAIDFNDVDFCLRLRRAGYRIVYTPYAELYHLESGSISDRTWNPDEAEYMKATWADVIARDPYYNPNLTRVFPDYRLP